MFGFNSEEAIRCFLKALSFDSNCAMARVFLSHSCSPNYNNPNGLDPGMARDESQRALDTIEKIEGYEGWEVALIRARPLLFAEGKSAGEASQDYCNAMRAVYKEFGSDSRLLVALFAEALLMLSPWKLWTRPPNVKPAIPETEELVGVLERGLQQHPTHPGLCHFYIHTMELSATPEKALAAADVLRTLVPDQGHFLHMPSHIDMWVGQYKEAVDTNMLAVAADEKYVRVSGQDNEFYKVYRLHNYHFTAWAAMFDGQFSVAMKYAEEICRQLPPEAVQFKLGPIPIGAVYFEAYSTLPWHVLVRFGKWQEILDRSPIEQPDIYPGAAATSHYARGVAYAVLGNQKAADAEREKFRSALKNENLANRFLHNNIMHDPTNRHGILDVAEAVLDGEVEYHKGNKKKAFECLRLAVQRDTSLEYDEPWGWMTPARHALGALLLEAGELEEAEKVYREDLEQYKANIWSLMGLHQVLTKQNRAKEAAEVEAFFTKAGVHSEIKIGASCFCATKLCCQ